MVKIGGGVVWCTGCYNSNYINQWGVGLSFLGGLVGKILLRTLQFTQYPTIPNSTHVFVITPYVSLVPPKTTQIKRLHF